MHSLAQHLQSQGRGNDTVLVHMTPREVGGLQALAQSAGGTLTRNPTTGLPEAGFLDSILPMIAGVAGGALGINPYLVSAGVGAITGIATGNLEKGLMSGLGAYGGAALGRTINPEGTIGGFGFGTPAAPPTPSLTTINAAPASAAAPPPDPYYQMANSPAGLVAPSASPVTQTINVEEPAGFFGRFSANAARGLEGTGLAGVAPYAAGLGLATPFLGSSSSGLGMPKPTEPRKLPPPRMFNRRPTYPVNRDPRDSSEFMFFPPEVPYYPAYADGGAVEARPRYAPDVAAPAGYAAQAPARSYVEQLYNFPRATNVPKLVKPTAEAVALQTQYPTATKAQLSEYERAIAGGGDPSATRSLMQAYGPTSGIKELQPWSPDFKGFDYARSRPVDAFGNPVGWELPARTAPTMGADGVPSGWDPRDWENMKNFDPGSPSDEYILNNPWMGGMQFGPAPLMSQLPLMSVTQDSSGKNTYSPQPEPEFTSRRLENAYNIGLAEKAAGEAGAANNQTALNYVLYGTPDAPEGAVTPEGFAPKTTPSTGSNFLGFVNQIMAAPRSTSTAAPSVGFFNNPVEYVGNKVSDTYNDLRNIGNWTTGEFVNAGLNALPTGLPGIIGGVLAGGLNVPLAKGNSFITSPPLSYGLGQDFREFIQNLGKPSGQAAGGVNLEDGSFVVDARTVAELGNGSSGAGQELLARMGGKPIKGPGDGVSDSIRANIGGKQEARVARDEVKFSPKAVKKLGGGDPKKGAARLYAMMRKAEKARKTASRGKDTGLRALVGFAGGGKASVDRTPDEEKQWRDSYMRMYDYGRLAETDPIAYLGFKSVGPDKIKPWQTPLNVQGLYFRKSGPARNEDESQMYREMGVDPLRYENAVGVGPEAWDINRETDPLRHELRHAGFNALGYDSLRSRDKDRGVEMDAEAVNRLMDILTKSKNAKEARAYLQENYGGNFKTPEKTAETLETIFSKRLGDLSHRARKKNAGKGK